jgi:hypothetical protein
LVNTFLGFAQNSSEREATSYHFPEELRENPSKHPPAERKNQNSQPSKSLANSTLLVLSGEGLINII